MSISEHEKIVKPNETSHIRGWELKLVMSPITNISLISKNIINFILSLNELAKLTYR